MKTERWFTTLKTLMVACVYVLGWSISSAATHPAVTVLLGVLVVSLVAYCFVSEEGMG